MKIVKIKSGLGNQMFQYAFAKAYAAQTGESVLLDLSSYKLEKLHNGYELGKLFKVELPTASAEQTQKLATIPDSLLHRVRRKFFTKRTHIIEDESAFDGRFFGRTDDCYFEGYWQSEKYFDFIKGDIPKIFDFLPPLNAKSAELAAQLTDSCASLHVRRGDYLLAKNRHLNVCTEKYYENAIDFTKKSEKADTLIVFSDNITWCKTNIDYKGLKTLFVDWNTGSDSWQDMYLMSKCAHNILANSSFSWWGAYLNANPRKTVLAPKCWNAKNPDNTRILPPEWTGLEL